MLQALKKAVWSILWSPETPPLTVSKILEISTLPPGWRFGEGLAFSWPTMIAALRLEAAAREAGFTVTDAFPGPDGDITISAYRAGHRHSFTVFPAGLVDYLHETIDEELASSQGLPVKQALLLIRNIGGTHWKSFDYSTSGTMTLSSGVFGARYFATQATEAGFQYSPWFAPSGLPVQAANMQGVSIPPGMWSPQFSGLST